MHELNEQLAAANAEKSRIEAEVLLCAQKLQRAEKIITNLGGERLRWAAIVEKSCVYGEYLLGDVLLASGMMSYLAPFTAAYRQACLEIWQRASENESIAFSQPFNFVEVLGTEVTIQHWTLNLLPTDNFSIENAVIMQNSMKHCLFVDPQHQANRWIKSMEKANNLKCTKFASADFFKSLESCLEFGRPLLIENLGESLDAALDPILQPCISYQGANRFISIGVKLIPYSADFRLYLTTSLANPGYGPEACNKVTIINFVLTIHGLEDQLLDIVVAKERPDLDEQRKKMTVANAANRKLLVDVENNILNILGQSKGDILEDEEAIEVFERSKNISEEIAVKQEVSKRTADLIQEFREGFREVAKRASTMYYCVADLGQIDAMYQFSVNWYQQLYVQSIENANKCRDVPRRVQILLEAITRNLYANVCRSIFEKDKLLFSFMLTMRIFISQSRIDADELRFLLELNTGSSPAETQSNPATNWLPDKNWSAVVALEKLPPFQGITRAFKSNLSKWRSFYQNQDSHLQQCPSPFGSDKLTQFHKLFILNALRPDKIAYAIYEYVKMEMGIEFVSPPQFNIAQSFDDSSMTSPIVFILSEGTDPMSSLMSFAEKMGVTGEFRAVSLGQGQGPIARKMITDAQMEGGWVCLQNCHLMPSFMGALEAICESTSVENTSASFRLWLTTYPTESFPSIILQNSVKVTNEPPTGLQQNLIRCYTTEPLCNADFYNGDH